MTYTLIECALIITHLDWRYVWIIHLSRRFFV